MTDTRHDHLTDAQRHMLLEGHDEALVRLAEQHQALVVALRVLEAEMRQLAEAKFGSLRMQREWDRAHTYELQWADRLAALVREHGG